VVLLEKLVEICKLVFLIGEKLQRRWMNVSEDPKKKYYKLAKRKTKEI
jgi:hypothetical protein